MDVILLPDMPPLEKQSRKLIGLMNSSTDTLLAERP